MPYLDYWCCCRKPMHFTCWRIVCNVFQIIWEHKGLSNYWLMDDSFTNWQCIKLFSCRRKKHSTAGSKNDINYDLLMEHFQKIQRAHREHRLIQRKRSFLTNDCWDCFPSKFLSIKITIQMKVTLKLDSLIIFNHNTYVLLICNDLLFMHDEIL